MVGALDQYAEGAPEALLSSARIAQLQAWNDTRVDYPQNQTIVGRFEQQAAQSPDGLAVVFADRQLTYAQLNQQANQIAHQLIEQGVQADTLVGICVEPSLEMMVGVLGILKSGGAYVPLDPAYPAERLRFMLEDSRVGLLLTQHRLQDRLPLVELEAAPTLLCLDEPGLYRNRPTHNPTPHNTSDDLAYVIYTSGSTGRPKGVLISRGNLLHSTLARKHYYPQPVSRFLLLSSLAFDSSVAGIFWTLLSGGALVLPEPGEERALDRLTGLIAQHQISHTLMLPGLYHLALQQKKADLQSLRVVIVAGEACSPNLIRLHQNRLPATALYNEYGPTEGTVWCSAYRIPADDPGAYVPIGAPIANTRIYILDEHQQPLPPGIPGELCIAGAGLARGYLNRPELTAEKFIKIELFGQTERIYQTGDLARWLPDGNLEYLGRIDHQIKLRGYRIELGEIEAALTRQTGIEQCLVVCTDHIDASDKRLIAYIVPHPDHLDTKIGLTAQLRDKLGKQLPDYMVPSAFVVLERFPLTPNGKVDRKALPAPAMQDEQAYVAPRNAEEERLAAIWADVLGLPKVGIRDNFFALGGHSLLAMQLTSQMHEELGIKLPLQQLFNTPTIAQLSLYLQQPTDEPLDAEGSAFPAIEHDPAARHAPFPLNDIQQAYWLGRDPGVTLGNVTPHFYQEVDGPLFDVARLEQTWQRLVERHEMLRTVVLADGRQKILSQAPPYTFARQDLSGCSEQKKQRALADIRQAMSDRMFDPAQWPLFDIRVTQLDAASCRLHFTLDILVADGWSFSILSHEWWQLYQDPSCALEPLELSFRDYVLAEQDYRQQAVGTAYQNALQYWRQRIADLPPGPQLPLARLPESLDRPRFTTRSFKFNPAQWRQFKQKIAAANTTPSTLLLTLYADILALWAKSAHFTLNLTLFNRLPVHAQINRVVGDFTSLILLEIDQREPLPLIERVKRVQQQLWQDLNHRSVSAVQVLRDMATQNNQHDLMPVVFTSLLVLDTEQDQSIFARLGEQAFALGCTPQVWLDNVIMEDSNGVEFFWFSVDELFPAGLLDDLFAVYQQHIEQLLHEDAAWHTQGTQHLMPTAHLALQRKANATQAPQSGRFIHSLFNEQVTQQASRTAVISGGVELSYRELHARVLQLAHWLRQKGIGRNQRVAVVMDKGWEQVVAVLGIVYAGGAYVPIDAEQPESRQHLLLHKTDAQVILTRAKWCESLNFPQNIPILALDQHNLPPCDHLPELPDRERTDLAYIIYTSGSTGKPKGVAIDHRGAVNTLEDINRRLQINPNDRVLALSALNFDLSVYDIFGVLGAGGALVIPEPSQRREPQHWAALMEQHQVTLWNTVPALMQMLVDYQNGAPLAAPLRLVMMSGDWIPLGLPERIQQIWPDCRIWSLGGATEASIWSIVYPIETIDQSQNSIPYGKPMDNQTFWVLDDHRQPRPTWATGELYIGGIGLAQGYWNDPAKTDASFIIHPKTGERLYKTGDLGRWLPDGNIEFMGREDAQVKVRGHRIELGEIEAVLNQHQAIGAAVVTLHQREGSPALAAYVVSSFPCRRESMDDGAFINDLRTWLADQLPDYMIPASFTLLDALPLTPNGKVDRKALPEPDSPTGTRASIPPRDLLEWRLLQIWRDLLSAKEIHIHDNFFELGGHSLLAVRLMQQIEQEFDRALPISLLFQHPTVAQLADILRNEHPNTASGNCIAINTPTDASESPIFLLPGTIGSVLYLQPLAAALGDRQALYALQTPGLHDDEPTPETIETLAAYHIAALRVHQPDGPYHLLGHSSGGRVAFEMAHQLEQQGETISLLGILDANAPNLEQNGEQSGEQHGKPYEDTDAYWLWSLILVFEELSGVCFDTSLDALRALPEDEAYDQVLQLFQRHELVFTGQSDQAELRRWVQVYRATTLGHTTYQTGAWVNCPIHLFRAQERSQEPDTEPMLEDQRPDWGWSAHTTALHTHLTPGSHVTMMMPPQVQQLAGLINSAR